MAKRDFKVGDKVIYYRDPSIQDWYSVGVISHPFKIGDEAEITEVASSSNRCLRLKRTCDGKTYGYLPKEAFKLVDSKTEFEKGDYIVTTAGTFDQCNCGKKNYCFKIRETCSYVRPCVDLNNNTSNGTSTVRFDKSHPDCTDWRYATNEEIETYDKLGKPYDVTTISIADPIVKKSTVEATLKKAKAEYPIGTCYICDGDEYTVNETPRLYSRWEGDNCIIGKIGGGLIYNSEKDEWAKIVVEQPAFSLMDWVITLDTPHIRRFSSGKAIGHVFQITDQYALDLVLKGKEISLDPKNTYGTNYELKDIRLATSEEIATAHFKFKFKIGDVVMVTREGSGAGADDRGKQLTITARGSYGEDPGYRVAPPAGNTLTGSCNGFIGEVSFTLASEVRTPVVIKPAPKRAVAVDTQEKWDLVSSTITPRGNFMSYKEESALSLTSLHYGSINGFKVDNFEIITFEQWSKETGLTLAPPKSELKIGDFVEIFNLDSKSGRHDSLSGIIGHKGKIVKQDSDGMFRLEPSCVGTCWYPHNLRLAEKPVEKCEVRGDFFEGSHKLGRSMGMTPGITIQQMTAALRQVYQSPMSWEVDPDAKPSSEYAVKPIIIPVKKI